MNKLKILIGFVCCIALLSGVILLMRGVKEIEIKGKTDDISKKRKAIGIINIIIGCICCLVFCIYAIFISIHFYYSWQSSASAAAVRSKAETDWYEELAKKNERYNPRNV